jgi:cytochrome c
VRLSAGMAKSGTRATGAPGLGGPSTSATARLSLLLFAVAAAVLLMGGPGLGDDRATRIAAGHLVGHGGPIKALASDPRRQRMLTGSFDYAMMLWRFDNGGRGTSTRRFDEHDGAVNAVAFHPDGQHAFAASDDGALHLWDLQSGKLAHRFLGHKAKIVGLAVSHDGLLAASASWDRTVRVWDIANRRVRHTLSGHTGPVNAVAFSADGRTLLSAAYDGTLRLWDTATGALQRVAYKHGWGINALARLGADDTYLFGALDGTVAIYDLKAGRISRRLEQHDKPVLALAVLDKPGLVASGGGGGEIRVYRQGDWQLLETYKIPLGPVWALAFADAGARLYFGSLDDYAIAWQVSPRKPFEAAPSQFPRRFQVTANISQGERQFARKCSICHTLKPDDANRAGPTLYRIFGRRAGTLQGYPYSPALKRTDIVWNEETIGKLFELGPDDYTPGSKMPLQRISDKAERDALIDFLKRVTGPAADGKSAR